MAETPEEAIAGLDVERSTNRVQYVFSGGGGILILGPRDAADLRLLLAAHGRAQYVAGLEAAARVADDEATAYQENAIACDRSGNIHGGTMDSVGVCASRRIAEAIRELADQAKRG